MVTSTLLNILLGLLDQKPHLFQEAVRRWKKADNLQSLRDPSIAPIKELMSSLLEALGYRCFPDDSTGSSTTDFLVQDPLCLTTYRLRINHYSADRIGSRYLKDLIGSVEDVRIHTVIVIFVLIPKNMKNATVRCTGPAITFMKKSLKCHFLDGAQLIKKVYSMT